MSSTVLPPYEHRVALAASLVLGSVVALLGVYHAIRLTDGSASIPDYMLVLLIHLTLAGVPLYLLFRQSLVTPVLFILFITFRALTFTPPRPTVEGLYPGLIIVWPFLIMIMLALGGIEWLFKWLFKRLILSG